MSNVVYLVHRIPFPPDKGDKIRSCHLLRYLSARHRVYLGAFYDDPADRQYLPDLKQHCAEVFLRPVGGWRSRLGAGIALLRGRALGVGYYADPEMTRWVRDVLARERIDAIVAFSSTVAQYFAAGAGTRPTLVADFVDVDSDKWRQYAEETRWPASLLYRYEAQALAKWEAAVLQRADAVSVVSEAESRIVPGLSEETRAKVRVVPNGVDATFFDPALDLPDPYDGNRKIVLFTGAMDYYANVDGVCWFADEVWPTVLAERPDAEFWIVGSNPTAAVAALGERPGITVTGRVPDVRPYLRHAAMAVAPLRLARGVQNKVLEALAMNLPVVARPEALRGLSGDMPPAVRCGSSPEEFAATVTSLLDTGSGVPGSGRDYVLRRYDWEQNLTEIDALVPTLPTAAPVAPVRAGVAG
jgi:sugar transferase (PEP-CTERM/EpsH1 system associated)